MFCSNCGKLIKDGAKFCENCGCQVTAEGQMGQDVSTGMSWPGTADWMEGDEDPVKQKKRKRRGEKKKRGMLWLIFAAGSALAAYSTWYAEMKTAALIAGIQTQVFLLAWMYGRQILHEPGSKRRRLLALTGCLLILPYGYYVQQSDAGQVMVRTNRLLRDQLSDSGNRSFADGETETETETEAETKAEAETDVRAEAENETKAEEKAETEAKTEAENDMRAESESGEAEGSGAPDGVDPDLKAFLDSYETFMDEYIDFMNRYDTTDNTAALLLDYLSFMEKYADFAEKMDAYDEDDMSNEDAAYYLEVLNRVNVKLLRELPE